MDGRKCIVYLPNDRKLDLTVQNKQLGKELWNTVVSELKLIEEDYFGLTFRTAGEHYAWLQDDKKVLDHDIDNMKSTDFPLEFIFSVKCYEDSVTVHKHPTTVELIFLFVINQIYKEEIFVSPDLSLELAAIALQAFYGDFTSEQKASSDYRDLACLPRHVTHGVEYCEEQVISWYKNYQGISRGQAILLYMSKAEKLSNYGVHFFKVKDKARTSWWLGISNKGIYQYSCEDRVTPHTVFQWRNLENLYFREKKFLVEVCSGHKRTHSAGSTNNKDLNKKSGHNNHPKTHTWYGTPGLIKSIWMMAIAQHQFYWDRKQPSKGKSQAHKTNASNLRNSLDNNSNSLIVSPQPDSHNNNMPRKTNRKHSESATLKKGVRTNGKAVIIHPAQSPEMKAVEKKMVDDLKQRKTELEDRLYDKVQELKALCLEEFNVTEKLPIQYIHYHRPGEEMPTLKKKIGAEFQVELRKNPTRGHRHESALADELQQLENDCNLLNQITKAAYKLAYDPMVKGRLKRKRLQSYQKSLKKLEDVENKIDELRSKQGKEAAVRQSAFITTSDLDIMKAMKQCGIDDKSERSSLSDGILLEDETSVSSGAEALSTHSTPALSTLRPNSNVSADVDVDEMTLQRSRTPPPSKSKLTWSPHKKSERHHLNPVQVQSYPILQSPSSYRSNTSSGTDTPPHRNHGWIQSKWEQPRQEAWKVSSLDSLDSIGSRKSNEQIISGSPHKLKSSNSMNANARRIARASEVQSHKASHREKHRDQESSSRRIVNPVLDIVQGTVLDNNKDSRTSLTDSGHGTDSRVQSFHEDAIMKQKNNSNSIRRDISDSSLSELSTQSNPAVLPSSGVPKFVPYLIASRNRALAQPGHLQTTDESSQENEASNHIRKRSSSFTESGSGIQKPSSHRDPHRTLTRSKTHNDGDTLTRDTVQNESTHSMVASNDGRPLLSTSQSANELPPPMFDTNLNICRQYLSRSQGQLAQNNADSQIPAEEVVVENPQAYSHDFQSNSSRPISANNSNNKRNFGQIYQLSKANSNHDYKRLPSSPEKSMAHQTRRLAHTNVPKSNSLDSVLDQGDRMGHSYGNPDTVKNYAMESERSYKFYPSQNPQLQDQAHVTVGHQRSNTPQVGSNSQIMTSDDRDKFNNEAFVEIQGMAWVPSLDDYGSRASVAESLPAKSKKEDIMELLQQHIADRRPPANRYPSTSSTNTMKHKMDRQLQARIRAEMMKEQKTNVGSSSKSSDPNANTWEGYKQNMQTTLKRNPNQATKSDHTPVNIFAHKQPPPSRHRNYGNQSDADSGYSQNTLRKGYVDQNGYISVNAQVEARNLTDARKIATGHKTAASAMQHGKGNQFYQPNLQANQQIEKKSAKNTGTANDTKTKDAITSVDDGTLVIQATRTSPNGHKVSVFTVTKSGPNTPLPPKSDTEDDGNEFFSKKTTKSREDSSQIFTSSNSQKSQTNISDSSTHSQTDVMQGIAIEAARVAQEAMGSSSGSLDKLQLSNPPPLPRLPPNSKLRSSTRGRRATADFNFQASPQKNAADSEFARTQRSRSKNRRDRESSGGRAISPATPRPATGVNGVVYPVKDLRSGAKTPTITQRVPSPIPTPKFHRTLSTPIRTKAFTIKANGGIKSSSKNTKTTGMYNEPVTGTSARSRPPAAPRTAGGSPNLKQPSRGEISPEKASGARRPVYHIGQSGTLPRNIKSSNKLERSGSITGSIGTAGSPYNRSRAQTPQVPGEARNVYGRQYIPTPRKNLYKALLGDEDLKYKRRSMTDEATYTSNINDSNMVAGSSKPPLPVFQTATRCKTASVNLKRKSHRRSLSETWKQPQNLVAVNMQQHHHHAVPATHNPSQQHHYHHTGHRNMMPNTADVRMKQEPPRRTASADDLLWSDGRDPSTFNIRAQHGTLV